MNGAAADSVTWEVVFAGIRDGDLRLLLGLVVILAIVLSVVSTRRQVALRRHRIGLILLRSLALVLGAAWLLEPVLVRRQIEAKPSVIPVLIDVSASMDLEDEKAGGNPPARDAMRKRSAAAAEVVAVDGPLMAELVAGGDREVVLHGFAGELASEYDPEAPSAGTDSAPAAALSATLAQYRGRPTAGIVVVTDGRRTAGVAAAVAAAEAADAKVPVSVITVGDPRGPRSLRVVDLVTPERTLAKEAFTIDAAVHANGLRGEFASLIIEGRRGDGDWTSLAQRDLRFDDDTLTVREQFTIDPQAVGKLHVRARVDSKEVEDPDDMVKTIDVMPERLRVLLIAGSIFPEVQFLRTALIRDSRVTCASWLLNADARYRNPGNVTLDALPTDMEAMDEWDCVVLYDPDPDKWPIDFGKLLYRFVAERGGGLVYVAGAQRSASLLDDALGGDDEMNWLSLLPVVREPGEFRADLAGMLDREKAWPMELTAAGRESELFRFEKDFEKNKKTLSDLPGMYWHLPVTRERPGAVVMARHGDERMRNRHGQHVLMATQLFGPGRTWFVGVDSLYRWRYLGENVYAGFWARMLSSASRGRLLGSGPLRLSVSPDAAPGVPVQVTASFRVSDDPAARASSLPARLETPEGREQQLVLDPVPGREGEFSGVFTPDSAGTWFARVGVGGEQFVAAATEKFDVRPPEREFLDQTADHDFGTVVATRTGGKAVTVADAAEAAEAFSMLRVDHVREERRSIWDHWAFYGILLLILFGEWIWRKALRQP